MIQNRINRNSASLKFRESKKIYLTISLLFLIGIVFVFFKRDVQSLPVTMPNVTVVTLMKSRMSDEITAIGIASAYRSSDLTAKSLERVAKINFKDGDLVKKGSVIVRLEQDEEVSSIESAKANLEFAKREYEKAKILKESGAVSGKEFAQRESEFQVSTQALNQARARLGDRELIADFSGRIGLIRVTEGDSVNVGEVIATIDDSSKIRLDFEIATRDVVGLKEGDKIIAKSDALEGRVFAAKILDIDSRINSETGSVKARALLDNQDFSIKPGLAMEVTIFKNKRAGILVPEEAIMQKGEDYFVWLVTDGIVSLQQIKIASRFYGSAEIKENSLLEGSEIVTRGIDFLSEGMKPQISKEDYHPEGLSEAMEGESEDKNAAIENPEVTEEAE